MAREKSKAIPSQVPAADPQHDVDMFLQTSDSSGLAINFASQFDGAALFASTVADKSAAYHMIGSETPRDYSGWLAQQHQVYNARQTGANRPPVSEALFVKPDLAQSYATMDRLVGAFHAEIGKDTAAVDPTRLNQLHYLISVTVRGPASELDQRQKFGLAKPLSVEEFFAPSAADTQPQTALTTGGNTSQSPRRTRTKNYRATLPNNSAATTSVTAGGTAASGKLGTADQPASPTTEKDGSGQAKAKSNGSRTKRGRGITTSVG